MTMAPNSAVTQNQHQHQQNMNYYHQQQQHQQLLQQQPHHQQQREQIHHHYYKNQQLPVQEATGILSANVSYDGFSEPIVDRVSSESMS